MNEKIVNSSMRKNYGITQFRKYIEKIKLRKYIVWISILVWIMEEKNNIAKILLKLFLTDIFRSYEYKLRIAIEGIRGR